MHERGVIGSSLRTLEPWERRIFAERQSQGRMEAERSKTALSRPTPVQLREEIRELEKDFRANWRQIAYLQGQLQVADAKYRHILGRSLRSYLEALGTASMNEWL
jgi:hypothetical protein